MVIFPSTAVTNDMICRNIIAVDDIILEGDEVFTITVVPSNLNDVPGISMATVIIQDNGNGKSFQLVSRLFCAEVQCNYLL